MGVYLLMISEVFFFAIEQNVEIFSRLGVTFRKLAD